MTAPHPAAPRHPLDGVGPDLFREALGRHASGVVAITAIVGGTPVGLTATSFTSVSLAPPLISFYIADSSTTWPELRRARLFGVHLLAAEQADLAARFAARGADRFAPPTAWRPSEENVPLIDGAVAHVICDRHETHAIGDHWLVVGHVRRALLNRQRSPLLYHKGAFGGFARLP
ncbi:flavin reductase family protein [Actinomadura soli]|uniref:Flavin reductase family protein n=1 Tax=Actinomadura soli TaxID=2508997 RepID=A0A5C4JJV8_9ACTN|nr:flavin reductase family protein [Actinomadura soli]TMR07348.1 flavin reductase family protein [Actinomadura soli]